MYLGDVLLGALSLHLLLQLVPLLLSLHTDHPVLPHLATTEVYSRVL